MTLAPGANAGVHEQVAEKEVRVERGAARKHPARPTFAAKRARDLTPKGLSDGRAPR